ncbi:MAG: NUDIX hydrolase [Lachnospiraceae bacterium]|nr:NUDIX hydrolase [Lachnospiraceae bacterium]
MLEKPERIKRDLVHNGAIVDVYRDTMQLPDGSTEYFDFIKHKGAAAVLPVMDDGRILMVKQYRNAIDSYTLELPAGGRNDAYEPTLDCAYRELEEETGYKADKKDITFLLSLYTTVAFCNEKIDIYLAKNLYKTAQHLDDDEFIDVGIYTLDELTDKVLDGGIVDAKTIAGLMTYRALLEREGDPQLHKISQE